MRNAGGIISDDVIRSLAISQHASGHPRGDDRPPHRLRPGHAEGGRVPGGAGEVRRLPADLVGPGVQGSARLCARIDAPGQGLARSCITPTRSAASSSTWKPVCSKRSRPTTRRTGAGRAVPADAGPVVDGGPALDAGLIAGFYDRHARDLPWRAPDATPWAVLVSEFMLQQTPVARVLPVYGSGWRAGPRRPIWPPSRPGEAVRAWGRLGYPRRALRLHARGRRDRRRHGGEVPADGRGAAAPARRRRVHRPGRRRVRVRRAGAGRRHQRATGAVPGGPRRRRAPGVRHRRRPLGDGNLPAGRSAVPRRGSRSP